MNDLPPGGRPPPPGGYGPQAHGPTQGWAPPLAPPVAPWPSGPSVMAPVTHPLAIVGLVAGCVQCIPGSGIAALVFGFIARGAIRREPQRYTGDTLALVAIVLGAIHVALGLFYVFGVVSLGLIGALAHGP